MGDYRILLEAGAEIRYREDCRTARRVGEPRWLSRPVRGAGAELWQAALQYGTGQEDATDQVDEYPKRASSIAPTIMDKVVYFLGAGFSAPLGLPVTSNFIVKSKDMYAEG